MAAFSSTGTPACTNTLSFYENLAGITDKAFSDPVSKGDKKNFTPFVSESQVSVSETA